MCIQQLVNVVVDSEALSRVMCRQGFTGLDPDQYLAIFPEDLRDAVQRDIRETGEEVWAGWSHVALECLVVHTKKTILEFTGISLDSPESLNC